MESLAVNAALGNTDVQHKDCATMGEKLEVRRGEDVVVSIVVRDPDGTNYSPYTFDNPSLAQIGMQPAAEHAGARSRRRHSRHGHRLQGRRVRRTTRVNGRETGSARLDRRNARPLAAVPAGAKNTSAAVIRTFNRDTWDTVHREREFKMMTFRIRDVKQSQYIRLRGTNLPPSVPFETDADGNPLTDMWTNPEDLPREHAGSPGDAVPENALAADSLQGGRHQRALQCRRSTPARSTVARTTCRSSNGVKYVAFDVAAWADLWFYSNPIFIEVRGSTPVDGVAKREAKTSDQGG